jgi:CheY-like chemotaxis protein
VQDSRVKETAVVLRCGRCQKRFSPANLESESTARQESLPAEPPPREREVERKKPAKGTGPSVLIADEARSFSDRIASFFRNTGARVITARDGTQAWEIARNEKPHLAFINVYLPKLLGFEVCERIKALPDLRDMKVILIGTLFRNDRFRRKPESFYGADEYVEDTLEPEELEEFLEDLASDMLSGDTELRMATKKAKKIQSELQSIKNENAKRLARTILSDVLIYNSDLVEEGIKNNSFHGLLEDDLMEGREYFSKRFPPSTVEGKDVFSIIVEEFVIQKRIENLTAK